MVERIGMDGVKIGSSSERALAPLTAVYVAAVVGTGLWAVLLRLSGI